jgi:hypothetical protein
MFFERPVSREYSTAKGRKNNSRWTSKEVERLARGVSRFGVGQWTLLKQEFFKSSIRTAVNLKVKHYTSNALHPYDVNSSLDATG